MLLINSWVPAIAAMIPAACSDVKSPKAVTAITAITSITAIKRTGSVAITPFTIATRPFHTDFSTNQSTCQVVYLFPMQQNKSWEEMTKKERASLIVSDSQAYMDIVPTGHWLLILDGIAKIGALSLTDESNATQ